MFWRVMPSVAAGFVAVVRAEPIPLPGLRRSPWSSLRFKRRGHYRHAPFLQAEGEAFEKLFS